MSSQTVISVKNVSKNFKLPHQKSSSIKDVFVRPLQALRGGKTVEVQHALKDISFDVKQGEFFGIVGRNGGGKSTLLKILAGIYQPTSGSVSINGRLVPFIELGVGFNPELTGRENVYLSGALNGFSEKEIDEMYDDIVEFAELEQFMDQQLKNYSSGMQVRLAFSVATRSKADILVLDEVLAVGDESFQRKCDDYFDGIKKDKTKTVILVTHSMEAVRRFCSKAVLIQDGLITISGSPEDVANGYSIDNVSVRTGNKASGNVVDRGGKPDGLSDRVPYFKVSTGGSRVLSCEDSLSFNIEYEMTDETPVNAKFSILDDRRGGFPILQGVASETSEAGRFTMRYNFPLKLYNNSSLRVTAVLDEKLSGDRIAYTNQKNSLVVILRNNEHDSDSLSLLRHAGDDYGGWVS